MKKRSHLFPRSYSSSVDSDYSAYLANRDVYLVGPLDKTNPDGVIVRFNNHAKSKYTHVLYHTTKGRGLEVPEPHNYASIGLKFAFFNLVDSAWECGLRQKQHYEIYAQYLKERKISIGFFAQGEWEKHNPYGPEFEWLNDIHKQYDCKLLTGLVALADIMRREPKSITVSGMDLYIDEEKRLPNYRDSHFLPGQIAFLADAQKDERVTLCDELLISIEKYNAIL